MENKPSENSFIATTAVISFWCCFWAVAFWLTGIQRDLYAALGIAVLASSISLSIVYAKLSTSEKKDKK